MADIMDGPGVSLLDRLDFLRGYLTQVRELRESHGDGSDVAEIDEHLATVDDACEALQVAP
jgi:hypothetical protein